MKNKILIADDSPTIQKVISITLANKDYVLDSAHDEDELLNKLDSDSYGLVLLDYNLSDTATGKDLCAEVLKKNSETSVIAMLGTFDSVEESELEEVGFFDKVIKPFESNKFIQKIEKVFSQALDDSDMDEDIFSEEKSGKSTLGIDTKEKESEEESDESFDSNEWSIDGPLIKEESSDSEYILNAKTSSAQDFLKEEMAGWGMSVPEVIGEEPEQESLFPPSIESSTEQGAEELKENILIKDEKIISNDSSSEGQAKEEIENLSVDDDRTREIILPKEFKLDSTAEIENDLEQSYPDVGELDYPAIITSESESELELEFEGRENNNENQSKLTHLNELNQVNEEEIDSTDPQLVITPREDSPDLLESLNEEVSPDDFWAADVTDDSFLDEINTEEPHSVDREPISIGDEQEGDFDYDVESPIALQKGSKVIGLSENSRATLDALSSFDDIAPKSEIIDTNSLAKKIKKELVDELKPLIKEMIKEALSQGNSSAAQEVAWEIIPDLAENLIRKEMKEISKKVMDKHSLS